MSWLGQLIIFAAEPPPQNGMSQLLNALPFVAIGIMFIFLVWMPNSRDQKERLKQLGAMKKNDRVFTSSGIIGTVANISADGKEVTLKVDDNVKIRVFRKAIEGFYADSTPSDTPPA